jgi:AraC-like DNA-binding protein
MKRDLKYRLPFRESTFHVFTKSQAEPAGEFHFHPEYELNLVTRSTGLRYVGSSIGHFEEGDLILLAPNVPHCWQSAPSRQHPYTSLVIQWKEDLFGGGLNAVPEFEHIQRLLLLAGKGIKFDKHVADEIRKRENHLLDLPPFEKLIMFLELMNELARSKEFTVLSDHGVTAAVDQHSSRITTIYAYIRERYREKITLADVARQVNMSEGAFSRFFSQTTQKPFFSFLNEFRISVARRLLAESDLQAKEVGFACGYECQQFFYRQFAKYVKCSPQAYRRQVQSC